MSPRRSARPPYCRRVLGAVGAVGTVGGSSCPRLLFALAGRAQVGLDDGWVSLDFGRGAGGDYLAEAEHNDALGDRHDEAHVVLDQQHADAQLAVHPPDDARQLDLLGRVCAGGGLVQEDQLRPGAKCPGDLQTAPIAIGERAGQVVSPLAEADEVEQLQHPGVALAFLSPGTG